MSANTFFNFATWINTEIHSAQLHRTNSILQSQLSGAASMLEEQAMHTRQALQNEKEIEALREIVFTTKKQLNEILEIVDEEPLEGLVFYLNSLQAFDYIDPSFFPSFDDKEYVDQVRNLVSKLEAGVHSIYTAEQIKNLLNYPAVDSIYADLRYRRFFVKGKELASDKQYRGFFGLKKDFLQDLKAYCTSEYSDSFWQIYIRFENAGQAEDAVNYRLARLEQGKERQEKRFKLLEKISLIDSSNKIFSMRSDDLEKLEESVASWLENNVKHADSIGLSLQQPGSAWGERIKSDYHKMLQNRM